MNRYKQHSIHFLKHITIALIIALAAIGITSCSTDDNTIIDLPNESTAVLFHTVVDKDIQTRGASMDNDVLKNEGFGVLAYYTQNSAWTAAAATATPNFMHNQKISWSTANSLWDYSPIKYWPNNTNDKVSFFAYAPFETSPTNGATKGIKLPTNTATGTPSIDFSINGSITNQVDLVYASAKDKNREVVDFQFKHALSRIGFSAKTSSDYGDTKIKVTSLSIKGKVYPSATFTFDNLSNDGSWGSYATPVAAGITYAPNIIELSTTAQQINNDDQYIMIIPQEFEGANKITIETTYTIDGVLPGIISEQEIDFNFEQGKAYNITLNISLSQIEITVEVSDWNNVNLELAVQDGQHKLGVSQGEFTFFRNQRSYENELVVTTNYPQGWKVNKIVDALGNDINTATNSTSGWLAISPNVGPKDASTPTTLSLKRNESNTTRTGFIHLSAGRLNYVVKINQLAQSNFGLSITDATDKPISILDFVSKKGVRPDMQQFNLEWAPVASSLFYNITPMSANAFSFGTGYDVIPASGSLLDALGTKTYSIRPPAITSADLVSDPFLVRNSILLYTISNGAETLNEALILSQHAYNMVPVVEDLFMMDGNQKSFNVRSNTPFTVTVKSNPNNVISLITTSGPSNTSEAGTPVYFNIINDMTNPTLFQRDVVVTIKSPQGHFDDYDVTLNCISRQLESNSYIVKPNSTKIFIPVSRANKSVLGNQLVAGNAFTAELVWTDNANRIAANSNIKSIATSGTGPTGYLVVEPGSGVGNAVVAIRFGGKILWSWHIWVADFTPTGSIGTSMDRNLGAITNTAGANTTKGMFYQWGRKDPFPGSTSINANTETPLYNASGNTTISKIATPNTTAQFHNIGNAVANPATFYQGRSNNDDDWFSSANNTHNNALWGSGGAKTVYDPCPVGWRVPELSVWSGFNNTSFKWNNNNKGSTIGGIFYPGAGCRIANGNIDDVGGHGYYWSATIDTAQNERIQDLYFANNSVSTGSNLRGRAYSVRCVKE